MVQNISKKRKNLILKKIKEFNFFDEKNYITSGKTKYERLSNLMIILNDFQNTFVDFKSLKKKTISFDFGEFDKKISPSLESYVIKGTVNLDIKPTGRWPFD